MHNIFIFIYFVVIVISIVFLVKLWITMNVVKDIRDILLKQYKQQSEVDESVTNNNNLDVDQKQLELLIQKLKPDQCVVYIERSERLEIWNRYKWEEVVRLGETKYFHLLHKNF